MYCAGNTLATPGGIPGTILPLVVLTLILLALDTLWPPTMLALRPKPVVGTVPYPGADTVAVSYDDLDVLVEILLSCELLYWEREVEVADVGM